MTTAHRTGIPLILIALLAPHVVAQAEDRVILPGVGGEYVRDQISGIFTIEEASPGGETHLFVSGHITPGTFWSCETDTVVPYGSELNVFFGPESGDFVFASVSIDVPPEAGQFAQEVPLELDLGRRAIDLFAVPGTWGFDFYVGYHPDETPHLCYVFSPGIVAIESAMITANAGVPNALVSWGSVKRLYR
jgi:hypothetical protein